MLAGRPVQGRQAGKAGQPEPFARGVDRHGVFAELAPHDGAQPLQSRRISSCRLCLVEQRGIGRRQIEQGAFLALQPEGDRRMSHGEPPQGVGHMTGFSTRLLQELEAGGRRKEEIAYLDPGAGRMRGRLRLALRPALDLQDPGSVGANRPRGDREAADRGDRRQRLAAETKRANVGKIVARQLRGAVPLDGELQLLRRHADAVVDDGEEGAPALLEADADAAGTGIDRILHQLLHRARRTLDHFAGGDAVDERRG